MKHNPKPFIRRDAAHACNKGLNEMAGEVVNQAVCFYQTFVLSESVVLQNRHFVKPRTVSGQAKV